jgi:hypothetical protein
MTKQRQAQTDYDHGKKWKKLQRQMNPERVRRYERERMRRLVERTHKLVIDHYSNGTMRCSACGIQDMRVLSIDHISGAGNKHRREINVSSGWKFGRWLIRENYPEGYQVLCMNCQFIKRVANHETKPRIQQDKLLAFF